MSCRSSVATWTSRRNAGTTWTCQWWPVTCESTRSPGGRGSGWEPGWSVVPTLGTVGLASSKSTSGLDVVSLGTTLLQFCFLTIPCSSSEQGAPWQDLGERQAAHVEAVEVWTQLVGSGRQGEHEPSQLCDHGQPLRGQARLHGRPWARHQSQRCRGPHMARSWTRWGVLSKNSFCWYFCFRQDHSIYRLCVQSGSLVSVRLKSTKARFRGLVVAAEVRGGHKTEHSSLQPKAPLRLSRADEGPLRLHQGHRSSQQMAEALQRCALWGDGLLKDQPLAFWIQRLKLCPKMGQVSNLRALLKVKWWLFWGFWLPTFTDNAIWQSEPP